VIHLQLYPWSALSQDTVEQMFRLRQDVFISEQQCIYPDLDGWDPKAWHMCAWAKEGDTKTLAACCRIFPEGVYPPLHDFQVPDDGVSARIGRIVTDARFRRQGIAAAMVREALGFIRREALGKRVRIAAQRHLAAYYAGFGFREIGEPYEEDGIPHTDMLLTLSGE